MKIISKFKDYYDSVQGLGFDNSVHYMRKNETFTLPADGGVYKDALRVLPKIQSLRAKDSIGMNRDIVFIPSVIYFCGSAYVAISIREVGYSYMLSGSQEITKKTFYSLEPLLKFLGGFFKDISSGWRSWGYGSIPLSNLTEEHFTYPKGLFKLENDNFILSLSSSHINPPMGSSLGRPNPVLQINPKLEDFEFYKVMPPAQAYQEIEMYISGVLGQTKEIPLPISDKDRIQQHGFDNLSFRKSAAPGRTKYRT